MTKIFNLIAVFLIFILFGVYTFFKETRNEVIDTIHNNQITYVKEVSKNLSDEILFYCKDDIYNDLKNDSKLRAILNFHLQSFITSQYKYIYVIDKESEKSQDFRFLLDGAKKIKERSFFNEDYTPLVMDMYNKVYKTKKEQYFKHKNMKSVSITHLYPIVKDDKVKAIIVIDFSLKEQEIINRSLEHFNNVFITILALFIIVFIIILWFSYMDKKREEEKKKIYNELLETSEELKNLNDTLEVKIAQEVEKNHQKDQAMLQYTKQAQMGEMISMIAHQWRQPLNAISATSINLSLLDSMQMLEGDKLQIDSNFIQHQCQKMSETIDTFMNFVKPTKEATEFSLSNSIDSIMLILGTQFQIHGIEINIDKKKEINLIAYKDLLEQVVINILTNARDAFEEQENNDNKLISITIDEEDDKAIIFIEDNAGGIPEHIQDKIFNPYFTTKEQGKGTGIGLYMSLDIIQKSFHGNLEFYPTKNGSIFKIILAKKF